MIPFAEVLLLRLSQHTQGGDLHRIEIALEGDGPRRSATAELAFRLSDQDEEDVRWYMEDYLQWPQDPAPAIAQRVETRMAELGRELFRAVFDSNGDSRKLWYRVVDRLAEVRVEIVTGVEEATSIPWELLRDPATEAPLALSAGAFVRAQPTPARAPRLPAGTDGPIRILLVICRPQGRADVPFRSVASQLVKGLDETTRTAYDLDVLRPPTFERLARVLREAKERGRPYHVVHFDGHGTHLDLADLFRRLADREDEEARLLARALELEPQRFSPRQIYPGEVREGAHGYLVFENPDGASNTRLVAGTELGKLLAETDVPVLVLNACRSAHAEPPEQPQAAAPDTDEPHATAAAGAEDPHTQVRALGSLAQEVMDAGVAGVMAMRYNVWVVTAAQFVAELYASLARGRQFGEAATLARKNLAEDPLRAVAFDPLPLQDWPVPVVYEAAPIALFPQRAADEAPAIRVAAGATAGPAAGGLDPSLPPTPDAGFFGRDEILLALDRAFDRHPIVLLHAYAGSGKTATAAEFARWYALTGGVEGPVLFSSFEHHLPLPRLLDRIGQAFGQALEQNGVHWLALEEAKRREVALQILDQFPVLWIWDNVEPVAGFPAGAESAWSADEQRELLDFLRAARETKAKFLLTSRRDERGWLGDLPARIPVPPMPMTERLQLARALAEKHGRRLTEVDDWRPLLKFTEGNPLTVTVLVDQALRDGLSSRVDIEDFVVRLRSGEATFDDEASEGRSRSLGASLAYGFEHAFSEKERRCLALLHLFQGFVDVDVLVFMGQEAVWSLPEVRGLSRRQWTSLLDRVAETGLLTAHGSGCYSIHPALPWFFKSLFEMAYSGDRLVATRAFVEAVGELGHMPEAWDDSERHLIRELAVSLHELGQIRRLQDQANCAPVYEEALRLIEQVRARTGAAACASNLGHAYLHIPALRDLDRAEQWYRRSFELYDERDGLKRGSCLAQLGTVAQARFSQALKSRQAQSELLRHLLNQAADLYHQALELLPQEAVSELAIVSDALGMVYSSAGDSDRALPLYRRAIQYEERAGDLYSAAATRINVSVTLLRADRPRDALEYATAALRGFESFGDRAADEAERTRRLIADIHQNL